MFVTVCLEVNSCIGIGDLVINAGHWNPMLPLKRLARQHCAAMIMLDKDFMISCHRYSYLVLDDCKSLSLW